MFGFNRLFFSFFLSSLALVFGDVRFVSLPCSPVCLGCLSPFLPFSPCLSLLFFFFFKMVSGDSVDRLVDGADDQSEVRPDFSGRAIECASTSALGAAGEIAPEEDLKAAQYGSQLGARTLTRYYSTYQIPDGVVLTTPGEAHAFEAPGGSVALYEQSLMTGLRFPVPWFLREFLLFLGLAPRQLMPNAWRIAIGCMVLWELAFGDRHHLTLSEFFCCYIVKEQEPWWFFFANWDPPLTLITGLPSSNSGWKTRYFFISGDG